MSDEIKSIDEIIEEDIAVEEDVVTEADTIEVMADDDSDVDEYDFDEEIFDAPREDGKVIRHGRKNGNVIHYVIFGLFAAILIFAVIRLAIWNKGVASDYDPNADTTEYDVEPTDYIQPLNAEQIAQKSDDGVLTILTIGASPFGDNYPENNLATAIGKAYGAEVINIGMTGTTLAQSARELSGDTPADGLSLYPVANALASGDFAGVTKAAEGMGDEHRQAVETMKSIDMSKVDAIFIMYDIEDYVNHRTLGCDADDLDPSSIYGALDGAAKMIQEKYPYIRIVMLSTPSCGKTIDGFYVDGDINDIGCGTLTEYMNMELSAAADCGISFIDLYYGAINPDNRDKYIYDDYHINDAGAEAIAARIVKVIPSLE